MFIDPGYTLSDADLFDVARHTAFVEGRIRALRLGRRLWNEYTIHVETGRFSTLQEAVKHQTEKRREAQRQQHARSREEWEQRQLTKERKRWRHLQRTVVANGGPCVYCGDETEQMHVDHVIPRAQNGQDRLSNLVLACRWCNWQKCGRTPAEWKAWRFARGEEWPPDWSNRPCHTQPTVDCPTCSRNPQIRAQGHA